MVRTVALTAVFMSAIGCSHVQEDEAELIRAALSGRDPQLVIVLPAGLPENTKRAARSVGHAIAEGAVPKSSEWTLPPGYFVLHRAKVTGAKASVAGLFGPVPAPKPGMGLLACGTRVSVEFTRVQGHWQQGQKQELVC